MTDPKETAMPNLAYEALPTKLVRAYQRRAPDANGMTPERVVSDGGATPYRHCLRMIPQGASILILAHRPFPAAQPYAEVGPIFLCTEPCERFAGDDLPPITGETPDYLIKGYTSEDRIRYGTGAVVPTSQLRELATDILARDDVAYVHVRSARNNCYQFRIDRA